VTEKGLVLLKRYLPTFLKTEAFLVILERFMKVQGVTEGVNLTDLIARAIVTGDWSQK